MSRMVYWKPIIKKFEDKLSSWKSKTLSFGGKLTLIKAVLANVPLYYFSVFKVPNRVIETLEGLRRRFLWGGTEDKFKIHWVKWDKVTAPKEAGGLGVGSLKDANIALLAKWKWSFLTNRDSLWVKVFTAIHTQVRRHKPIPINLNIPGIWKQILKVDDELAKENIDLNCLMKMSVGDGALTRFWKDVWIDNKPLMTTYPELFALEVKKDCLVVDRAAGVGSNGGWNWEWKRPPASGPEVQAVEEIQVKVNSYQWGIGPDRMVWYGDDQGVFSAKSLRKLLESNRPFGDLNPVKWLKWVPLNVRCFLWKASLNRIASKEALSRRGVEVGSVECPRCFDQAESTDHILISCAFSCKVCDNIGKWAGFEFMSVGSVRDCLDRVMVVNCNRERKWKLLMIVMGTMWFIWRSRNRIVFGEGAISVAKVVEDIKLLTFSWLKHRSDNYDLAWHVWCTNPL